MSITLPVSSLVVIALGSVGVTLSLVMGVLLLWQKDRKHLSVTLLGCLLILSGLTLLNDILVTSGMSNRIQSLYFIPIYYTLSIPPLFYLFVKSKFKYRLAKMDVIHAVLPIIQAAVYFSVGFRSVAYKSKLYAEPAFRLYLDLESFLFTISLLFYGIGALTLIQKKEPGDFFWSEDIKKWLRKFSIGMLWIALLEFAFSVMAFGASFDLFPGFPFNLVHTILLSAFVFWIAVNGFKQYYPLQIFTTKPSPDQAYLHEKELSAMLGKLEVLMRQEQIFLNPDLNLELLSRYLGISEKRCSYLLRKGTGLNFNQYVNHFRVEAFKERIRQGRHKDYTLTSIAYDCGFSSKSTFNRVFKQHSGMTPSEFVKTGQEGGRT